MSRPKNLTQKNVNQWLRTLWFGINYINSGKILYEPKYGNIEDVNKALKLLQSCYKESSMPTGNDEAYNKFLYEVREALVNGKL